MTPDCHAIAKESNQSLCLIDKAEHLFMIPSTKNLSAENIPDYWLDLNWFVTREMDLHSEEQSVTYCWNVQSVLSPYSSPQQFPTDSETMTLKYKALLYSAE